ncbi:hypothetical protein EVAR_25661_1 [Eumeta japonica]|uniref:Uncharacterized protein n=1 Tax=Eumeta variegata TaxID=151549 RepID=A0A4C1WH45_EUMVA|nr:hypothetical protein EVAR_25661_1 [Eumeta japonica]
MRLQTAGWRLCRSSTDRKSMVSFLAPECRSPGCTAPTAMSHLLCCEEQDRLLSRLYMILADNLVARGNECCAISGLQIVPPAVCLREHVQLQVLDVVITSSPTVVFNPSGQYERLDVRIIRFQIKEIVANGTRRIQSAGKSAKTFLESAAARVGVLVTMIYLGPAKNMFLNVWRGPPLQKDARNSRRAGRSVSAGNEK